MVATIFFALDATCPKTRCLDQNFCARIDKKAIVTGSVPIVPHAEGHIGADVLLLLSREDPYDLTVRSDHKRGRRFFAAVGRLPCVEGAPIPKPGGFGSSRSKRVVAVHDECARRLRICEYEKRQHKNVSVPEHMPLVRGPAQPASANRHTIVLGIRRAQQMINGKAQRALRRRIALDPKVGCVPSCQPGITVRADRACHVLNRALNMFACHVARLAGVPRGVQGDDPIEPVCLAQPEFETLPAFNQFGRGRPAAGGIRNATCHRHRDRRAVTGDLDYGTGQCGIDESLPLKFSGVIVTH